MLQAYIVIEDYEDNLVISCKIFCNSGLCLTRSQACQRIMQCYALSAVVMHRKQKKSFTHVSVSFLKPVFV